ncbi:hypothetical protein BGZ61DRAFT_486352 [Ilyonectria robusta]|uniref:uncharacterized protein n=1 Tax=Ilyonectria robusta TaxID=1079257 RepID=UPI001E8DFE12|nr:uncharacterized protein BGZ61DRAFT_486352 [Ilyonectria robusta]KAH8657290.1 hypothetical protein BGZ61DRAFT_486352 [Ilyonectria robusta]
MVRSQVADLLILLHERRAQHHLLSDAMQHLGTILRRLPRDSPDRPKYLSNLSYAKMSEYKMTSSRHGLDEAVSYGRQANEMAATIDLFHCDPNVYLDVQNNLGFALALRYALIQDPEDLDSAVACAKETYDNASKDSKSYNFSLNNLASRLRMRYLRDQNPDDINEARRLANELRSRTTAGTTEHAAAAAQLGIINADKFKQTDKLEDLDEALRCLKSGLPAQPDRYRTQAPALSQIVDLYSARYQKTNEEHDMRQLAIFSGHLFLSTRRGNPARGEYLLNHVRHLYKLAVTYESGRAVKRTIRAMRATLEFEPPRFPQKQACQGVLAHLLAERYCLTQELEDLVACVDLIEELVTSYNEEAENGDSSKGPVQMSWLWDLSKASRQLEASPWNNDMRKLAERELSETFRSYFQGEDSAVRGLKKFYHQRGIILSVLAEAAAAGRTLSDDEIASEITKLEDKKAAATREHQKRRGLKTNDYENEIGLRKLAMDEAKNGIDDMSGLVSDVLGWDATKSYSTEEFAVMTAQGERKALDEARLKGRHPNLRLCRMCRDEAKVLQPTADGFELTAKAAWLPFGNFFQLRQRKDCSVCSLILSVITTRSGSLHPRLAAIDPEVQGVRLSTGRLSTNEKLMRIDYGNKHVSELRVLTPQNYSQALRQAWEMDAQSTLSGIFYNRNGPIYDQSQQRINPDLVKSWLNNCDHNHSFACNHPRSGKRAENKMRLTLIDVKEECLVSASSDAKYFALSYVWGRVDMSKTLKSNYEERIAGTDADAGLPGVCAGTREPQKITTLTISNKSLDLDDDPDSKDVVYFQCGQETLSEGGANEEFEALMFDEAALSDNHILEKANRNNPLCSLDAIYDLTLCERLTKAFNTYTKLVGTYSQRNLSFKSDILKAFAGIFAVLEEHFHVVTLHGLPAAVISHALLWSPAARIPRRGSQLPTNLTLPTSGPDPQFPSWSWVGWDGPVEYRVFKHSKGEMFLPAPRVKIYDTINGPISDIIQGQKGALEPAHQAPDRTGSPDNGRDDQGGGTGNRPDKEEPPREHVLAKMVPDHFRGSIWIVGAPQVPQDRKDPHIATKLLRFTARTVPLPPFQVMLNKEYLSCMSQVHVRSSQAVRRIQDRNSKHCGLWWEQAGYGYVGLGISPEAESKIDMH